jgi:type II secretory pathway pseudopilin PulG
MKKLNKKGSSIIEIIVAVGIFTMLTSSVVVLFLGAHGSNLRDKERLQADLYLQEAYEALRSIRDYNFANLTNGTHGISSENGYWELAGSSDIQGQFTREITISEVERNANCEIVESGTIDSNSKEITTIISWELEAGNPTSITSTEYIHNWADPSGCGMASNLVFDVSAASLNDGGKRLENITIENNGSSSVTIDKILPTWTNENLIKEVKIDGTKLWKHNGEGTPDGQQASGVELDNENYTIPASSGTLEIDKFDFDSNMTGASFTFLFTMTDGTARYIEVTPGSPPGDTTAPATVSDLATNSPDQNSINLSWTAPGDDGNTGTATSYDIRYSTSTITSGNWASATPVSGEPTPSASGSTESFNLSGLTYSTTYYFALKTYDEVPNESNISNIATGTTTAPGGDEIDDLTVDYSGAYISGGGKKELRGVTLENTGGADITLAKITLTWTNPRLIQEIKIEGTKIWRHNQEGSPNGKQPSGTELDVVNYTIDSGSTDLFDKFKFTGNMNGNTFTIQFEMSDGSTFTTPSFSP